LINTRQQTNIIQSLSSTGPHGFRRHYGNGSHFCGNGLLPLGISPGTYIRVAD